LNPLGIGQFLGVLAEALALGFVADGRFVSRPGPQGSGLISGRGHTAAINR
jgi:hypothetical protein